MIARIVDLDLANVQPVELNLPEQQRITLDVLRLDKVHPIISGNKWFKLEYALEEAIHQGKKSVVTLGGPYSNHILATAGACKELGLHSIGIIRGENPSQLSCTLKVAFELGMELKFVPRSTFTNKIELNAFISSQCKQSYFIEEGGRSEMGIRGAAGILKLTQLEKYKYICCSIGTGTMMAGLIRASGSGQMVIGFSSLKIERSQNQLSEFLEECAGEKRNFNIIYDYHFGGYARYNQELITFMNEFYTRTNIPLDFVYTGKLFYGLIQLVKKNRFEPGSAILVIHSGGLQGNCSLPKDTLLF